LSHFAAGLGGHNTADTTPFRQASAFASSLPCFHPALNVRCAPEAVRGWAWCSFFAHLGVTVVHKHGCQRDVVDAAIDDPSAAVLVAEEAGEHVAVGREHLSDLPAIVHVGVQLALLEERSISSFTRPLRRSDVQLFMAEYHLYLVTVGRQVLCQPGQLLPVDAVAALDLVIVAAGHVLHHGRVIVSVENDEVVALDVKGIVPVQQSGHGQVLLLGDILAVVVSRVKVLRRDHFITAGYPPHVVVTHHQIGGAGPAAVELPNALQVFQLTVMQFGSCPPLSDLNREVAHIDNEVSLPPAHLLHKCSKPPLSLIRRLHMGIGADSEPDVWYAQLFELFLCGRYQSVF